MEALLTVVSIASLAGVAGTAFWCAFFGIVMPGLMVLGAVDGPTGGRLSGEADRVKVVDEEAPRGESQGRQAA